MSENIQVADKVIVKNTQIKAQVIAIMVHMDQPTQALIRYVNEQGAKQEHWTTPDNLTADLSVVETAPAPVPVPEAPVGTVESETETPQQ